MSPGPTCTTFNFPRRNSLRLCAPPFPKGGEKKPARKGLKKQKVLESLRSKGGNLINQYVFPQNTTPPAVPVKRTRKPESSTDVAVKYPTRPYVAVKDPTWPYVALGKNAK